MACRRERLLSSHSSIPAIFPVEEGKNVICMECRQQEGPFPLPLIRHPLYKEEVYIKTGQVIRVDDAPTPWFVYAAYERYSPTATSHRKLHAFRVLYVQACAQCLDTTPDETTTSDSLSEVD